MKCFKRQEHRAQLCNHSLSDYSGAWAIRPDIWVKCEQEYIFALRNVPFVQIGSTRYQIKRERIYGWQMHLLGELGKHGREVHTGMIYPPWNCGHVGSNHTFVANS